MLTLLLYCHYHPEPRGKRYSSRSEGKHIIIINSLEMLWKLNALEIEFPTSFQTFTIGYTISHIFCERLQTALLQTMPGKLPKDKAHPRE